jgi:ribosomal protein S18 acetylase RimI-like enzyme
MSQEIHLRDATEADLPSITAVHIEAFSDAALTKLGRGAVRRYYEWQLKGPHERVALVAYIGSKCMGFCFGGVFRGATSGFLHRNQLYLCGCVMLRPWLLWNPVIRERLTSSCRILRRKCLQAVETRTMKETQKSERSFGILAIAVSPEAHGQGIGRRLMAETERVATQLQFRQMDLSVRIDNHRAIRFYEGLGWFKYMEVETWNGVMKRNLQR